MSNVVSLPRATVEFPASRNTFPVTERPLFGKGRDGKATLPVPNHKAIYRADEHGEPVCLGVVGTEYKVVKNADLYAAVEDVFRSTLRPDQMEGVRVYEKSAYQGAFTKREYVFPAMRTRVDGDKKGGNLGFRCFVTNGYDGSHSVTMATGFIDFYCTNGIVLGDFIEDIKRRHTKGFDYAAAARQTIGDAIAAYQENERRVQAWAATRVRDADIAEILKSFSPRMRDRLTERFEYEAKDRGGRNLWTLHSALTYYASHDDGEFATRNTGRDHAAATLTKREREVRGVVQSTAWRNVEARAA